MKECFNCGNYQAYYTKGYCKFDREDQGNCVKHNKIVGKHEGCEQWRSNAIRRKVRKSVCLKNLDIALSDLSEMKQILSENSDDDKNTPS